MIDYNQVSPRTPRLMEPGDLAETIAAFEAELTKLGYTRLTRLGYTDSARHFAAWLNVEGIGQLKQTLAEVIVVVLFVLFLRVALETFIARGPNLTWLAIVELLTLPVAIFLLSAALKLAELHPKPRPRGAAPASEPEDGPHEVTSSTGAPRLAKPRPPRSESARPR